MPAVVSRGRGRRTISEINMVPFIDVMLVLLIIFMVTAPLIAPSMIDLPSVGKAAKQPDQIVQIVIGKDESLELKTGDKARKLTQREVAAAVKALQSWPDQHRCGHQRRPQCEIRNRGQGHGHPAARRHPARGPVRTTGAVRP
jgi:biopolymer transport protein ExbD